MFPFESFLGSDFLEVRKLLWYAIVPLALGSAEGYGCHASVHNCFMYFLWRSAIGVSQLTNQRGCFRCTVVQSFASCFSFVFITFF